MLDIIEAGKEYDHKTIVQEELTETIVSLENFYANIGDSLDTVTSSAQAKQIKLYYQAIISRVGFESFTNSPVIDDVKWEMDVLSFESDNMFTKLWDALKKAAVAVRVALKKMWIKVMDHSPNLAKRAAAIRAKADSVDRKDPKEDSFDFGGFGTLQISGEIPKTNVMGNIFKTLEDLAGEVYAKSSSEADKVLKSYGKKLNKLKTPVIKKEKEGEENNNSDKVESFAKELEEFIKAINKLKYSAYTDKPKKDAPYGTEEKSGETKQTIPLFGNVVFYQTRMKDTELSAAVAAINTGSPDEAVKVMKSLPKVMRDGKASLSDDKETKGDVPTLKPKDISNFCDSIETLMKKVTEYNKEFEARDSGKESLEKTIEQVLKRNESKRDKLNKSYAKIVAATAESMRVAANVVDQPGGELSKYLVNTCNVLLNWFDKSLAQYSGKSDD